MIADSIRTRPLFPRSVLPTIFPWLDAPQAIVLVDSRQVGKTCILYLLIQHLLAQRVHPRNLFYFDLEVLDHLNLLNSLSFEEFLQFKHQTTSHQILEDYKLSGLLQEDQLPPSLPDLYSHPLQNFLDEYCRYGGYPAVVLEPDLEKKLMLLNEIYSTYVHRDLGSLFTIENLHAFNQLVQLLALEMGQLLNVNTLTTDLAISRPTLEKYLTILENTFIIRRVRPFFRRKKREVIKMPKLFFFDLGLRNLVVKQFGELGIRPDRGALMENFTFIHLYRGLRVLNELHFWRTKNGTEVDFVVQAGEDLLPIEVKYQGMTRIRVPPGMQSFLSVYPAAQAAVITKDAYGQKHRHNTRVIFLPAWLLGSLG